MKLKYPLEENSKIKKMKSFEQKLHFLFFILQLGKKKKVSQLFCCESVRKYLWLQRLSGQPECVSVFVYNCVYMEGRRETEPLQQGPRGSVLPSPALYEAVFWTEAQDQAWGTLLRSSLSRAPTLTDITSAGGRHSRPCVCVPECRCPFQLVALEQNKVLCTFIFPPGLKAWGVINRRKREKGG